MQAATHHLHHQTAQYHHQALAVQYFHNPGTSLLTSRSRKEHAASFFLEMWKEKKRKKANKQAQNLFKQDR
jgi:hypothetical protein